jgi:hypothetical protein
MGQAIGFEGIVKVQRYIGPSAAKYHAILLIIFIILDFKNDRVYACEVLPEDYIERIDGTPGPISRHHYFAHPEQYTSVFHEKVVLLRSQIFFLCFRCF